MKKLSLKATAITVAMTLLGAQYSSARQEDKLVLHYAFNNVNGTEVSDESASGVTATLVNNAKIESYGNYKVLNLGTSNGYLDMTSKAGDIIKTLGDFTVSAYYYVQSTASLSGAGYFLWAFSENSANTATAGPYTAYRLNAQRFATSTGGHSNESGMEIGSEATKGQWAHILYRQTGAKGELYLNGTRVKYATSMPILSSTFTNGAAYCWLGRAPFSSDNYLKSTYIADFRLYSVAVSDDDIKELSSVADDIEYEFKYGSPGDMTTLKANVSAAKAFLEAEDLTLYPASALAEYMDAITIAENAISNGKLGQTFLDTYDSNLTTAKSKFAKTKGFVFDISDVTDSYSTDRGFRHPGGLHTQEDFDRIKKQLAEGNEKVTEAYKILTSATYSQSSCGTNPVETIVRGGSGENYINAARGATIAYQNALRWKIDGSKAHADNAVKVLMAWCNTTKYISGTSDQCLARGLYGYQFAQAAELMRDYEGWDKADFEKFKRWMLDVWYPGCIGFLRARNGTWENTGKWWHAPGHYWSNWGLCNAMAVISIGVLCDDVFIYNQGMSFIKYDQVGTFQDPRTANPILNDGLTEFWGNLIVTTSESDLETGAYGKLGQMNESGRDTGHAAMAAGLAVDIAHQAWNQGDDLFSYMDHRLAAGIEYIAAQTQSVEGLPWTNYSYGTNGIYYTDSRCWTMTGPALGAQMRPYWGTVIGHYEGIKGVNMPFSSKAYESMGVDAGGQGSTSGGYDHLGYSVLMNTRDGLAKAEDVPTELAPRISYNGQTIEHNELGGLVNTYQTTPLESRALAKGTEVTMYAELPEGTEDTGSWLWSTGETTREKTVQANESRIYRVAYTNSNGVSSEQSFAIAVQGDCESTSVSTSITSGGKTTYGAEAQILYGTEVTLKVWDAPGFCNYVWDNGQTTQSISIPQLTTSRDIRCTLVSQGGKKQLVTFHLDVTKLRADIVTGGKTLEDTTSVIVNEGDDVTLAPYVPESMDYGTWTWSDGSTEATVGLDSVSESQSYDVSYAIDGNTYSLSYNIYVKESTDRSVESGYYRIRHRDSDTYLTLQGDSVVLTPLASDSSATQVWYVNQPQKLRYSIKSMSNGKYIKPNGGLYNSSIAIHRFTFAKGTNYFTPYNSKGQYWYVNDSGQIITGEKTKLESYEFELVPLSEEEAETVGIKAVNGDGTSSDTYFSIDGIQLSGPQKGLVIVRHPDGRTEKKLYR